MSCFILPSDSHQVANSNFMNMISNRNITN